MKLAPGQPLQVALHGAAPAARVAMAGGLAQLEWTASAIGDARRLSPVHYPPEPGLQAARTRDFDGLHGFLADSLPEGWGALLMRRRLAALGVDMGRLSALDRLALVGDQGRGSLTFAPATTPVADKDAIDLDALAAESQAILRGEGGALGDLLADLGGASGGARPKVHVGFGPDGAIGIGDGELPQDHAAWIVKFRAGADPMDIGPVEQAYAAMARLAGVTIGETRLIPARHGAPFFATRRFDRPGEGRRMHMVSLAGAIEAPPQVAGAIDYDMFLRATRAITRNEEDVVEAFRRMVFNVLAGNRDDHSRQHAYLMDDVGEWHLAPAYDLTFSDGPGGEHYLAVAGEGAMPTRGHVDRVARLHGIAAKTVAAIVEQVAEAVARWDAAARDAGVGRDTQALVTARLATIRRAFAG
ncbi:MULTISPECIES: type II toxin-antitoxin system HipA family toxin [unclassified Sphingomonas]|uniref:type II toxin-antitoxin system HipA family toxin n=1 Tax=unclassified Sphingomonas TaxID=196159 RepID=UPI0006F29158|nr:MULTISPECIES: type II toxin-antitoxin system HipA family toxin [unclassified Sphingomonas]KQM63175.1 phosphatidylinositol kinase [Sphingomonas sp. Leaf16]KQN14971.1 phosphatidylinositol kinase [Sphingomonas sp. Leaf29]KQN20549.1 phosphatidylinositol kinase [Sphingomonas sp. Leaf32]